MTGDYEAATRFFDSALAELPPNWIIRHILIFLPLMATYAHQQNRTATFTTAEKAVSALRVLNAASMNQTFTASLYGLFEAFPHDPQVRTFVADTLRQLPPATDHQTTLL